MLTEQECEVFHTLRVSGEQDLPKGEEIKTHFLYNGITANSWLTPIGISMKNKTQNKDTGRLNEECRKTINERAKGHNGIVGRKHFELTKQLLTDQDLVVGKRFSSASDSRLADGHKQTDEKPETCNIKEASGGKQSLAVTRPVTRGDLRRPRAVERRAPDTLRPFTAPSALDRENTQDNTFPTLLIRQCTPLLSQETTSSITTDELVKPRRLRHGGAKSAPPQGSSRKSVGFTSVHAMQEAYDLKLKQPLPAWASTEGRSAGGQIPYSAEEDPGELKSLPPRNRFDRDSTSRETPQSSLRPLMYNKESDVRHSAGCPYKCKSCFRACLASDDYIQDNNKTSSKPNSKVAERRAILRQNKPAWRGEQKQAPTPARTQPPWSTNRTRNVIRIIRKEVPVSAYAWAAGGPSYPPFTRYDTLITRQVRTDTTGSDTTSISDEVQGRIQDLP